MLPIGATRPDSGDYSDGPALAAARLAFSQSLQ